MHVPVLLLLVVHGALHLIGFFKDSLGVPFPALTGATLFVLPAPLTKVMGAAWLIACLLFLVAAALLHFRQPHWWVVAAVGIPVSQLLIIYTWSDAKVGTLPNVILTLAVVAAAAGAGFDRETSAAIRTLLAGVQGSPERVVRDEDLAALPPPVQRWLRNSGVVGRARPRVVVLDQLGAMKTAPGGKAMPARAEQHFTLDPPGFVWGVDVAMFGIPVAGRDTYLAGHGRMLIKAAGLWPIVDARGDAIDQGTLLRYLGELAWFPAGALARYLRWEPLDDNRARVTMSHGGVVASADFSFTPDGRLREISAQRYFTGDGPARLEPWGNTSTEWKRFDGVLIPTRGEVFWDLTAGRFNYYTWQITDLQYDPPALVHAS